MRHLDRNPALDERLEQRRRVLDRDTQAAGERGGRDDGCRRHDVDRNGRARTALTVLDAESAAYHSPSISRRISVPASASSANATRKQTVQASISRGSRRPAPWRRSAAGRQGVATPPLPIERKGRAVVDVRHHGRARQNAERGAEQRRAPPPGRRQRGSGAPDRLRLRLIGRGKPASTVEGMTRASKRALRLTIATAPSMPNRTPAMTAATCHVFLPGHRVRLEISSSNFPRFDRNLNTGRTRPRAAAGNRQRRRFYTTADTPRTYCCR